MKERGIIFNTEMVKAILDGRKTQTRRIIKSVPTTHNFHGWVTSSTHKKNEGKACWAISDSPLLNEPIRLNCPLGKIGDRLYVRETYCEGRIDEYDAEHPLDRYLYVDQSSEGIVYKEMCISDDIRIDDVAWKPSIHMQKKLARIWLEITDIRVERLNCISQSDAIAEGSTPSHPSIDAISRECGFPDFSRSWFAQAWVDIYGKESWNNNPWVWVIAFKKVE